MMVPSRGANGSSVLWSTIVSPAIPTPDRPQFHARAPESCPGRGSRYRRRTSARGSGDCRDRARSKRSPRERESGGEPRTMACSGTPGRCSLTSLAIVSTLAIVTCAGNPLRTSSAGHVGPRGQHERRGVEQRLVVDYADADVESLLLQEEWTRHSARAPRSDARVTR